MASQTLWLHTSLTKEPDPEIRITVRAGAGCTGDASAFILPPSIPDSCKEFMTEEPTEPAHPLCCVKIDCRDCSTIVTAFATERPLCQNSARQSNPHVFIAVKNAVYKLHSRFYLKTTICSLHSGDNRARPAVSNNSTVSPLKIVCIRYCRQSVRSKSGKVCRPDSEALQSGSFISSRQTAASDH